MALTNETVVGMIALFVMCVPGVYFIFQLIRRRKIGYLFWRSSKGTVLPTTNPDRRIAPALHDDRSTSLTPGDFRIALERSGSSPVDDNTFLMRKTHHHHVSL
ncbi:hypothetical protein F4819DRAFT_451784 [Hypoxylon fuscum]|nr:hypothetical protein F4819DRAFT_451784 [Hypoxylon fuscum]